MSKCWPCPDCSRRLRRTTSPATEGCVGYDCGGCGAAWTYIPGDILPGDAGLAPPADVRAATVLLTRRRPGRPPTPFDAISIYVCEECQVEFRADDTDDTALAVCEPCRLKRALRGFKGAGRAAAPPPRRVVKAVRVNLPVPGSYRGQKWVYRVVECLSTQKGHKNERGVKVLWESEPCTYADGPKDTAQEAEADRRAAEANAQLSTALTREV